jgi:hypothetical protein
MMNTLQMHDPVIETRISESARFRHTPGVTAIDPAPDTSEFPKSLQDFKWDVNKLVQKLKSKVTAQWNHC